MSILLRKSVVFQALPQQTTQAGSDVKENPRVFVNSVRSDVAKSERYSDLVPKSARRRSIQWKRRHARESHEEGKQRREALYRRWDSLKDTVNRSSEGSLLFAASTTRFSAPSSADAQLASLDPHEQDSRLRSQRRTADMQAAALAKRLHDMLSELGLVSRSSVVNDLNLLNQTWLKNRRKGGLARTEFVNLFQSVFRDPENRHTHEDLEVLFEKIDVYNKKRITWDDYLSFLLKEVGYTHEAKLAGGTWLLDQSGAEHAVDLRTGEIYQNEQQSEAIQMLITDERATGNKRKCFVVRDDMTIQVLDADSLELHSTLQLVDEESRINGRKLKRRAERSSGTTFNGSMAGTHEATVHRAKYYQTSSRLDTRLNSRQLKRLGRRYIRPASARTSAATAATASSLMSASGKRKIGMRGNARDWFSQFGSSNGHARYLTLPSVSKLVSESIYGSIRPQWLSNSIEKVQQSNGHAASAVTCDTCAIAYQPDQRKLYVAQNNKQIKIFQSKPFSPYNFDYERTIATHSNPSCTSVLSANKLLVGYNNGVCHLLDTNTTHGVIMKNLQLHSPGEPVRQLTWVPDVGLVSCGMDGKLILTDVNSWQPIRKLQCGANGVYAFDYCADQKIIATAGFGRRVQLWDPYYSAPVGQFDLDGGPIVGVWGNSERNQLFTVQRDKKVKVFDIRTSRCLQEFSDAHSDAKTISAACFDFETQKLRTSSGSLLRSWQVQAASMNREMTGSKRSVIAQQNSRISSKLTHATTLIAVLFSSTFKQLINVGAQENVRVVDFRTGMPVFDFQISHQAKVTCACLDTNGKRLITGAANGTVMIWNFSNGALLRAFAPLDYEVTQVTFLPHALNPIVATGWHRNVVRFQDFSSGEAVEHELELVARQQRQQQQTSVYRIEDDTKAKTSTSFISSAEHKDHVTATGYSLERNNANELLVTGDAAGGVILWNTISNTVYKRTTIPTHVQMLLYDHRYSYVKQQYKSARTRRRNSLTAEAHLLGGSRGEREKAGVSAVVFLDGLLIVGSADGNVYFMNPAGCHWTNSIVNITSTSAYPNEKRSILAMQASYEILTGDECVVRLAIVFSYGEPGEETTCLRFLRVINPLSAGHMELSTLRSVTTAQSIVAMQLIPDAVLTPCFGRDQNSAASRFLLLTADKSGEVRVMDEKGHHKGTVSDKLAVRPVLWWMDPSPDHRPDLRLGSVTNIVEQGKPAALVSPSPRQTYRAELTTQSTPVNVPAGGKNPAIASGVADLPVPKRGKPHEKPKHPAQSNSKTSRTMRTLQKHQLAKVPIPMKGMGDMHLRATKFMKRHRQELQQTQQSYRKLSLFDKLNETERLVMQRNRALLP